MHAHAKSHESFHGRTDDAAPPDECVELLARLAAVVGAAQQVIDRGAPAGWEEFFIVFTAAQARASLDLLLELGPAEVREGYAARQASAARHCSGPLNAPY